MPSKFLSRDRAWGTRYDTLGTSPPSSPTLQRSAAENIHSSTVSPISPRELQHSAEDVAGFVGPAAQKPDLPDNTPHDSSIFVGSLPASVDHIELSQRLREHLSAYPQIKGVKVVRDSRGGVCAFVQCDTPLAAGELLNYLQTQPPLPFLGRFLRFEPAKAFRTLLLSYRTPIGFASAHADGLSDGHSVTKVRLAHAMRIFRPRNAKYLGLLYDEDATNFSVATGIESTGNIQHDRFLGEGFLIDPLKYDGETLRALAAAFGPLELFKEYAAGPCPSPHDTPRSPEMSQGVWEVKWNDREDSVAALLTLRRVPHLNVSWAHHPPSNAIPSTRLQQSALVMPTSPGDPIIAQTSSGGRAGNPLTQLPSPIVQIPPPSTPSRAPCPVSPIGVSPIAPGWSTITSPSPDSGGVHTDATRWADQMADLDFNTNGAFLSLHTSTPVLRSHHGFAPSPVSQEPAEPSPPVDQFAEAHARSMRQTNVRFPLAGMNRVPVAGPAAGAPPGSPSITGAQSMWTNHAAPPPFPRDGPKELDPTTVFVGGLEASGPDAWDENKLRHSFGRFGNIENIHMVVPLNKRSAFAFIKFANDVSASRAVREEHNRIYGGRPIRVQLRERNGAPRGFWRPGRGRGRGRGIFLGPPNLRQESMPSGAVTPGDDSCADVLVHASVPGIGYSGPPQELPIRASPVHDPFATAQPTGLPACERVWQEGSNNSFSSLSSGTTKVPSANYEMSHGPPSTTASLTPPPSTASASTSVSSSMPAPYPVNMGYFPPQSWVQPYPAAYPFPVPLVPGYGYPGYSYAPVHAMTPAFLPARDPNAPPPSNSRSSQWVAVPGSEDPKVIPGSASVPVCHVTQPPLRATGFIQNEHGTLIPVYQREALDEYMANAHGRQPSPPAAIRGQPQSAPRPGSAHRSTDGVVWQPPLAMYPGPYPVHVQSVSSMPVPPAHLPTPHHPRFWMPGAVPYGVPGYHPQNHHNIPGPVMHVAAAPVSSQHETHSPASHGQPHLMQRNRQLPVPGNRRGPLQAHMGPGIGRPPSAAAGDRASLAMQDLRRSARSRGHSVDPKDRIRC